MTMLPLLGNFNLLPLLHRSKSFIWIEKQKRINEFDIGFMINTSLHVNKYFREQVENV